MSATALALILLAAVAHATWNLFSKQASAAGASSFVWLMSAVATAVYAPVVALSLLLSPPRLTPLDWVFMAGTGLLQAGYFLFLQAGYRLGDLSLVYPVGRGSGALLAALAGITLLGERPGPAGIAGIALVVLGVLALGAPVRAGRPVTSPATPRAIVFALVTGAFIASYTLWDKYAVSTLKVPPLIQGYASLPVMALVLAPFALREMRRTTLVWHAYRRQVAGAALLSPLAYILVLVAMSFTAVSAVAPAREVSVLAGVLLGRTMLGEEGLARRLTAAGAIAAGIICIAVG
ncbi:MAG TPA: DMT family transporter [Streptosporangiaceae bacterium]|nr:DMT family transporter [Streptosporangiaceae bacterium]